MPNDTSFPAAIDTFPTDAQMEAAKPINGGTGGHSDWLGDGEWSDSNFAATAGAAISALETKVGVNNSADDASLDARVTAVEETTDGLLDDADNAVSAHAAAIDAHAYGANFLFYESGSYSVSATKPMIYVGDVAPSGVNGPQALVAGDIWLNKTVA